MLVCGGGAVQIVGGKRHRPHKKSESGVPEQAR